jgi:hypothetical protein
MARPRKPAVETLPHPGGGWGNKVQGNDRFSNTAPTKEKAQHVGRDMARERKTEHIIKKQDGTIGERNSYGHDPYPPKG